MSPVPAAAPFDARADLPDLAFADLRALLLREAEEHDMPVLARSADRVTVAAAYGRISAAPAARGTRIEIGAPRADWLQVMREAVIRHLAALAPEAAGSLRWSDRTSQPEKDGLPPNVRLARIEGVAPLGRRFARATLRLDDLSGYTDEALHVRLCQPPPGAEAPAWPRMAENGATVWPSGAAALHRPAYTIRRVDRAAGRLEIDVFLHEGGRTTAWARRAAQGDLVALAGPGGGGVPDARRIFLFSDETGFPAVARILETLPHRTTGEATLFGADPIDYPMPAHPGIRLRRMATGAGPGLSEAAIAAIGRDGFLWAAGEKAAIARVRQTWKAAGGDPATAYLSAYWKRA